MFAQDFIDSLDLTTTGAAVCSKAIGSKSCILELPDAEHPVNVLVPLATSLGHYPNIIRNFVNCHNARVAIIQRCFDVVEYKIVEGDYGDDVLPQDVLWDMLQEADRVLDPTVVALVGEDGPFTSALIITNSKLYMAMDFTGSDEIRRLSVKRNKARLHSLCRNSKSFKLIKDAGYEYKIFTWDTKEYMRELPDAIQRNEVPIVVELCGAQEPGRMEDMKLLLARSDVVQLPKCGTVLEQFEIRLAEAAAALVRVEEE